MWSGDLRYNKSDKMTAGSDRRGAAIGAATVSGVMGKTKGSDPHEPPPFHGDCTVATTETMPLPIKYCNHG